VSLTVGSLFSGIGGLDLGLERAGMTVRWQSEIHPYACRVLAKHWPDVPNHGDITTIGWDNVERVDVICGGYPCQPFSYAGVRRGGNDSRHLWPYFLDAIRHLRPRYALLENVPGHLSLGFGRVLGDLAESGYDATWDCIPAAAVGAPHRRDRVFVVAHAHGHGEPGIAFDAFTRQGVMVPDTDSDEHEGGSPALGWPTGPHLLSDPAGLAQREPADEALTLTDSGDARQEPRGRGWWAVEPDVGRVADGVPNRVDRLYGLGNAVVPQVAEHVGRLIMNAHLQEAEAA
jgi:DNA (cytosine-5)-methyltransferase 1